MSDAQEDKPRSVTLRRSAFDVTEAHFERFSLKLPPEHELEDLLVPNYWGNVTNRLKAGSFIDVRAQDGSFYAEYYVHEVHPQYAIVEQTRLITFDKVKATRESHGKESYKPVWKGPTWLWCVMRASDGAVVEKGYQSEKAAAARIKEITATKAA